MKVVSKIIPINTCNNCNDVLSYKVNEPKRALSKFEYILKNCERELRERERREMRGCEPNKDGGDERR